MDIVFILFNLPVSIAEILVTIYTKILAYPSNTRFMASIKIGYNTVAAFAYMFYFAPFFLNLFFNKMFLKELIQLFTFNKIKSNKVSINDSQCPSKLSASKNISQTKMTTNQNNFI